MGDREQRLVQIFQARGRNSVEETNVFLTENKIDKTQIIECKIGYVTKENEIETILTIIYNKEWK